MSSHVSLLSMSLESSTIRCQIKTGSAMHCGFLAGTRENRPPSSCWLGESGLRGELTAGTGILGQAKKGGCHKADHCLETKILKPAMLTSCLHASSWLNLEQCLALDMGFPRVRFPLRKRTCLDQESS